MIKTQDKILLLGGSYAQIPAIKAANEKGLYTVLCDYLPDNPGQKYADEYINASTTDKEQILEIARERDVNYVLAYASDPAAPTSAYVSEKMGLPGNTYHSVKALSEKHLFRQLLKDAGLPCPRSLSFTKEEVNSIEELNLNYPLIVKPVDSSGSKGVTLIDSFSDFKKAVQYALTFSRSRRIIVEEFIDNSKGDLHGDGFVQDGVLLFVALGDHLYNDKVNPFNPCGTTWPSELSVQIEEEVTRQVQLVISKAGYENGSVNIEARVNSENKVYVMEIGPRNGGHYVPQAIEHLTGFDIVTASIDILRGLRVGYLKESIKKQVAYYAIHSSNNGKLKNIIFSSKISPYIKEQHQYVQVGDQVSSFQGSNAALGILLLSFPSSKRMHEVMGNIDQYIIVEVE